MIKVIEAVYEKGVFRPLQPLDLEEGQRVQVTLPQTSLPPPSPKEFAEQIRETHRVFGQLTEEEWDDISQSWKRGE
jgi:predicted DNA-binding antitoxin AbrB/MazE fold protein